MTDLAENVAYLVKLNGGAIIGRTRLQKVCYLLEARNIGFGIAFDYHHYGPYSADLALAADDAEALGYLRTEQRQGFHEVPYTVYRFVDKAPLSEDEAGLSDIRKGCLRVMEPYSAIVLELAATAVFLNKNGYRDGCWEELERRKATKVNDGRLKEVRRLLDDLDVPM